MTRSTVPVAYREAPRRPPHGVTGGVQVAQLDSDETAVFLIGVRINRLRKVRSWWPVSVGMPRWRGSSSSTRRRGASAPGRSGRAGWDSRTRSTSRPRDTGPG